MSTWGPPASGVRLTWDRLPDDIRRAVEARLGGRVVAAPSQPGGFSPGVAARLRTEAGFRAFIKAVSPAQNPDSPEMHRREARIAAAMPVSAPVPRLLDAWDQDGWAVLIYEDVKGRQPAMPWTLDEIERVMAAIVRLHAELTPCPVPGIRADAEDPGIDAAFSGWRRLRLEPLDGLDSWSRRHLDELAAIESGWAVAAAGDTLLHLDLRADNILIRGNGEVLFVDWPAAMRGAPFLDVVGMAPSVAMQGGPDLDWLLARHPSAARADPGAVTAWLAALAGYLIHGPLLPPPPGLPTLRPFQAAQGAVARAWLEARLGT
jgi:aminoglycoside phosphotransferase (APT) family kinase protein